MIKLYYRGCLNMMKLYYKGCLNIIKLYFRGCLNMIKLLINNGASPRAKTETPHKSPMQLAGAGGHIAVMEELAKHGYDWREKDEWGWTLLHEVAAADHAEAIRWVYSRSRCMTNIQDKLGRTPLLTALIAGAGVETVEELLKNGEDIAEDDDVGRTAAEASILYCSPEVIQTVLEATKNNEDIEVDVERLEDIAGDHPQPDVVKKIIETVFVS